MIEFEPGHWVNPAHITDVYYSSSLMGTSNLSVKMVGGSPFYVRSGSPVEETAAMLERIVDAVDRGNYGNKAHD